MTGVNVIARNIANPFDDAVSAISSDFATDYTPGAPFVGVYTLRGLTPGASYAVFVDEILEGGFSTPPRILPGPEEFYNGASESTTSPPTSPTCSRRSCRRRVCRLRHQHHLQPAAARVPLTDDSSIELFPDFPDPILRPDLRIGVGQLERQPDLRRGSARIPRNAAGLLIGPPRIAGLWDDLNPDAGGVVSFEETRLSLTVHFTDVPEFAPPRRRRRQHIRDHAPAVAARRLAQAFAPRRPLHARLRRRQRDRRRWPATAAAAGHAWLRARDRSQPLRLPVDPGPQSAAVYEVFTAADNDLDNARFHVLTPRPFRDEFEPNNTRTTARLVKLPFSTVINHTSIGTGDVDFFRFRAKAGEILAIETVPGSRSTRMIGLFDAAGTLLVLDDDGGVGGCRGCWCDPADGVYAVGVTTWPDSGFTGAGETRALRADIRSYTGTLLPLGDDGSIEVPLTTFQFPFQGTNWTRASS